MNPLVALIRPNAWRVFRRNLIAWQTFAWSSITINIMEPLVYFLAFGFGLGKAVTGLQAAGQFLAAAADARDVFVGELGLGGEVRRVQRIAARLQEAERLGFERAVVPSASLGDLNGTQLEVSGVASLREALERAGVADR